MWKPMANNLNFVYMLIFCLLFLSNTNAIAVDCVTDVQCIPPCYKRGFGRGKCVSYKCWCY
ncbi:putative scorpion short chain toxin, potassium channel inhibitor, knottin, scorpion toxin [Lupinus albus]|uniref:Putative scorpion short chain toxin, potassium channel inhibitor, knottin, scorpion toxin n=1 Tax=Lupinus albus TaxID=3870 RepID=A0A6A4QJK4_LUPAL|nr:putative scorpion short chain toxin, potassium channel inhibitor, knottin, scorpion toxin [Lupinus albus]